MKRFYKETAVDAGDGGWRVLLDGKPMRTPAKTVLMVPTQALAEAIAAEWRAVPEDSEINTAHLPLTRLAASPLGGQSGGCARLPRSAGGEGPRCRHQGARRDAVRC